MYDSVPPRLVAGLVNIVDLFVEDQGLDHLIVRAFQVLDRRPPSGTMTGAEELEDFLEECEWYELCDLCEGLWKVLSSELISASTLADEFSNSVNALFARRYFGYELRAGRIERVGTKAQEASVAKARGILRGNDLRGPDEQFQKAMAFFNRRPEPDCENTVKEAVSAVEGVARVLLGDAKLTLSKALKKLKGEKDVHPTLIALLEKLYAYRGDADGVGHALTGEKEVRLEDAEFALGVSASAIVYLARLYGRGVQ